MMMMIYKSGWTALVDHLHTPFDNVTMIYNDDDDDLQERVDRPCRSPGQVV